MVDTERVGSTGGMDIPLAALLRTVVFGAALAAYYAVAPSVFPEDDGLGTGLLAFAAIMAASLLGSAFDGFRRQLAPSLAIWAIVAVAFSVGWLVIQALVDADSSISAIELMRADLGTLVFTVGLVLAPAVVGSALGHALRPSQVS